jgi:hypothetical protein
VKPTVLPTPAADAQTDIVAVLKDALARAKAGEFSNVIVFASVKGTPRHWATWNEPCDRMMLVAHLERAKWELVNEMQTGGEG